MTAEDMLREDAPNSSPRSDARATIKEQNLLPQYVRSRREEVLELKLPTKVRSSLATPWIRTGVPLLMDILPKLAKLQFEDVDTRKQVGLERKNYMVMILAMPLET